MKRHLLALLILLLPLAQAATLQGSIYNSDLELEQDVFLELSTTPAQKLLSKDGTYSFELPNGEYTLTARKGFNDVTEQITIAAGGIFTLDLFLLPDLTEESELLEDTKTELVEELTEKTPWWSWLITGILILILLLRFMKFRKKYGSLRQFRAKAQEESAKTVENNPQYLEQALEIVRKHDGRIHQKTLRQELLHLSEAKVSLIVAELEHKGLIEKFKKGRGNIIVLKSGLKNQ
ncbi:hypothetical protein J4479_00905 [Candidatus Woesearchaeota archaeon]|nr:hypothetical protein [Candidatus Woesearchaeota archaeon]